MTPINFKLRFAAAVITCLMVFGLTVPVEAVPAAERTSASSAPTSAAPASGLQDDFDPGLFVMVLVMAAIVLALVGMGAVFGLFLCLAGCALVGLGLVSSALLYGLLRRSATSAARWFTVGACVLLGMVAGVAATWLAAHLMRWGLSGKAILLAGNAVGALAGLAVGTALITLVNAAVRRMSRH